MLDALVKAFVGAGGVGSGGGQQLSVVYNTYRAVCTMDKEKMKKSIGDIACSTVYRKARLLTIASHAHGALTASATAASGSGGSGGVGVQTPRLFYNGLASALDLKVDDMEGLRMLFCFFFFLFWLFGCLPPHTHLLFLLYFNFFFFYFYFYFFLASH